MSRVAELRLKVLNVLNGTVKDAHNFVRDGVAHVSTRGFSRSDVDFVKEELWAKYYVMNCHTFKVMRLESLDKESSATRRAFPTPFDMKKQHERKD